MSRLTPAQMRTLRAYALTGNRQEAGEALGITLTTVDKHLVAAYRALGVADAIGAYRAMGWLVVPGEDAMTALAIIDGVREAAAHVAEASAHLRAAIPHAASYALGPASPVGSSAVSGRAMTRPESEDAA